MNIILVLLDSVNRDHLAAYGSSPVATPNLDVFAQRAWRFDEHFVGSLPCMPARREILTGRKEMLWRPWGPVEPFDARLPELLATHSYATGIVTDHYHYWEEAANGYIQSFQSAELIRGHEIDFWKLPTSRGEPVPKWVENIERWRPGQGRRYYGNVKAFEGEEDFFPAKVMTSAVEWLDQRPRHQPFFLQVEAFDVHEPFHVPEPYASMYEGHDADLTDDTVTNWPPYQHRDRQREFIEAASPEALAFIRSQYFGKLTMVDRWLGEVFDKVESEGLWSDTMVMVTTDHGHDLGERGVFGKSYPHYDSHANIPLFVWHPAFPGGGRNIAALTSTVDLFATILDVSGADSPEGTHSRSMLPLLGGAKQGIRDSVLYGTFGQGVCCTNGDWTLFKSPEPDHASDLFMYTSLLYRPLGAKKAPMPVESGHFIPGVEYPQWKIPVRFPPITTENYLHDRRTDPDQTRNLWDTEPKRRHDMMDVLRGLIRDEGAPSEQWVRLGLGVP